MRCPAPPRPRDRHVRSYGTRQTPDGAEGPIWCAHLLIRCRCTLVEPGGCTLLLTAPRHLDGEDGVHRCLSAIGREEVSALRVARWVLWLCPEVRCSRGTSPIAPGGTILEESVERPIFLSGVSAIPLLHESGRSRPGSRGDVVAEIRCSFLCDDNAVETLHPGDTP